MIIDIYCKYPKQVEPIMRTNMQKILLKNKNIVKIPPERFITNIDEMKNIHNEFNNMYYWSNDFLPEREQDQENRHTEIADLNNLADSEKWL